ncbi:MAG: VOC family protein [Gemmatimonadales bacterium]
MPHPLDHLIYGTPDVATTVERLAEEWGVRPAKGGQHLGRGTHNALLALGDGVYLEILGPDPEQPDPEAPRWLGIDELTEERLLTWAAKGEELDELVVYAGTHGIELGEVQEGARRRTDGVMLTWQLTDPSEDRADGILPFFVDWGGASSPHPSENAPGGVRLLSLRAEHPHPYAVNAGLETLEVLMPVSEGAEPALIATLETPRGVVELR